VHLLMQANLVPANPAPPPPPLPVVLPPQPSQGPAPTVDAVGLLEPYTSVLDGRLMRGLTPYEAQFHVPTPPYGLMQAMRGIFVRQQPMPLPAPVQPPVNPRPLPAPAEARGPAVPTPVAVAPPHPQGPARLQELRNDVPAEPVDAPRGPAVVTPSPGADELVRLRQETEARHILNVRAHTSVPLQVTASQSTVMSGNAKFTTCRAC
jgi:hypothetical protein